MSLITYFKSAAWHNWFNTSLIALVASFAAPAGTIVEGLLIALAVFACGGAVIAYGADGEPPGPEVVERG